MPQIVVELLDKSHDRKSFRCKDESFNDFLTQRARKHAQQNFSKTWVAVEKGSTRILGYITVSMGSVALETADEAVVRSLPKYPIPVAHIGKLAVDQGQESKGIGSLLLRFAIERVIETSESIGVYAIELEAKTEAARRWYLARGFLPLKENTNLLYIPLETVKQAKAEAESEN